LEKIRGSSQQVSNSPKFPKFLWSLIANEGRTKIPTDILHDFLLILFGSFTFQLNTTSELLANYLKKCTFGKTGIDYSELLKNAEKVIKEGRLYFSDRLSYIPIRNIKEDTINTDASRSMTFRPDISITTSREQETKTWEERYKSLIQYKNNNDIKHEIAKKQNEENEIEQIKSLSTAREPLQNWNKEKEKKCIERLYIKKPPCPKINPEDLKIKEIEMCTHRPQINKSPKYLRSKTASKPKDFNSAVERLKKKREKEELEKKLEEKKLFETGDRLKKLRESKFNPPSLLNRPKKEKDILVNVDVTVYPGKYFYLVFIVFRVGRIGVRLNDDISKIAKNFCKAYSLNSRFEIRLKEIIEEKLQEYLRGNIKKNITTLDATEKIEEEEDINNVD